VAEAREGHGWTLQQQHTEQDVDVRKRMWTGCGRGQENTEQDVNFRKLLNRMWMSGKEAGFHRSNRDW
jgi:hypothetical protein